MSDGQIQPPGWYYAQGDPPNTQRYWDGSQWQGGPQPIAAPSVGGAVPGAYGLATGAAPADPGQRFIAFLIDLGVLLIAYLFLFILTGVGGAISDGGSAVGWLLGNLVVIGVSVYNFLYLQGRTGQTVGKKQQNIKLLKSDTMEPVGIGMAFVRGLVQSVISILCYIPTLVDAVFILTQPDRRRFTDKWLTMHVYKA